MTSRKYARVCCPSSAGHDANHALKRTLKQNQFFFSNDIFEFYYENCSDFILISGFEEENAYIKEVYSLAVKCLIFSSSVIKKTSVFSRVRSTSKKMNVFITRDNFLVFTEKEQLFFYLIVYTTMRASDVITNVTKQNMNVMA